MESEFLINCYEIVFIDKEHTLAFKAAESKCLLFDENYLFLDKPRRNWKNNLYKFLKENNIEIAALSKKMQKLLLTK